jgi:hypothetical protein
MRRAGRSRSSSRERQPRYRRFVGAVTATQGSLDRSRPSESRVEAAGRSKAVGRRGQSCHSSTTKPFDPTSYTFTNASVTGERRSMDDVVVAVRRPVRIRAGDAAGPVAEETRTERRSPRTRRRDSRGETRGRERFPAPSVTEVPPPGFEPEEDGRLAPLGAATSRVQIAVGSIVTAPFGRRKMPPPGFEPGTARSSVECSPSLS